MDPVVEPRAGGLNRRDRAFAQKVALGVRRVPEWEHVAPARRYFRARTAQDRIHYSWREEDEFVEIVLAALREDTKSDSPGSLGVKITGVREVEGRKVLEFAVTGLRPFGESNYDMAFEQWRTQDPASSEETGSDSDRDCLRDERDVKQELGDLVHDLRKTANTLRKISTGNSTGWGLRFRVAEAETNLERARNKIVELKAELDEIVAAGDAEMYRAWLDAPSRTDDDVPPSACANTYMALLEIRSMSND